MEKYIINADENKRIKWVGVNTENGLEIIEIKNTKNSKEYFKELNEINKKYGDFYTNYFDQNYEMKNARYFTKREKANTVSSATNSTKRKIAATAVAAAMALTIYANSNKIKKYIPHPNLKSVTEFFTDNNVEETHAAKDRVEGKSVEQLLEMLEKENGQERAFKKIVNTKTYFNETAAPSIKKKSDKGKQLFLKFDETTAAYLYANSSIISSEKLAEIFGKSKILMLNEETGEYEMLDKELLAAKYLVFNRTLSYYYQRGATEASGVDKIFESKEEAEFFKKFENKILKYNKNKDEKTKKEIRNMFEKYFMSGAIDSKMEKYKGASSIILTSMLPYAYLEDIVNENTYKSLVNINETITCQEIYSMFDKFINCKLEKNDEEDIIEGITKLEDKKVKGLNRNIDMIGVLKGYSANDLNNVIYESVPGFAKNKKITKHSHKVIVTKNRKKAVKLVGLKKVKKAEKAARKGLKQKNNDQENYWTGYQAGYSKAYHNVLNGGSGNVSIPSGSAKYVQGYRDGVAAGIKYGKQDLAKIKSDQENHKPQHREEVIEEEMHYDNNNNNSNNNNNNSNSNSSQGKEEVISEEMVYENKNNNPESNLKGETKSEEAKSEPKAAPKKVVEIKSLQKTESTLEDSQEAKSEVRTR